jgi:cytochrome c biogenesis protein
MSEQEVKKSPDLATRAVNLFSSVKLALVLIAVIIALAFLGESGSLGFHDVYHARYFTFLLGLLFINLAVCTIDRLPGAIKRIRMDVGPEAPPPPRQPDHVLRVKSDDAAFLLDRAAVLAFGAESRVLRRELEIPARKKREKNDATAPAKMFIAFHASGRWSLLGPHLTHLGILVTLLGAIIGGLYTFKGYVQLKPGAESSQAEVMMSDTLSRTADLDFAIRVNDFKVTFYKDASMPSDFLSDLSIIVAGQEAARKVIEVNRPLYYDGYGIFQSSYGPLLRLAAQAADGTTAGADLISWEPWTVPGSTATYMIVQFEQHSSGMGRDLGASVIVQKLQGDAVTDQFRLFENFGNFDAERKDQFKLSFRVIPGKYWTGLQLIKDPGMPLVWTGFSLLVAGVMLSFFVFHRRLWITARQDQKFVELSIIGRSPKAMGMFERKLKEMAERLAKELPGELIGNRGG